MGGGLYRKGLRIIDVQRVYLDCNATTPLDPRVLQAMLPVLRESFGNASSIHWFGQQARAAVDEARESVAALIGATPQEVVHPLPVATITWQRTPDGILFTWQYADPQPGDRFRVVRSDMDNPTVLEPTQPQITINDDHACIDVTIYRRNGQGGPAKRKCDE